MNLRKNFLIYTILPLLILAGASSYYRFMVTNDFLVSYEGICDPVTESCFVGCEDDTCENVYYYTLIERDAADLVNKCGDNISNCEESNSCIATERSCSITYCDQVLDTGLCDEVYKTFFKSDSLQNLEVTPEEESVINFEES